MKHPSIHVDGRDPDIFCKASGVKVRTLQQGIAYRVMSVQAVMTGIAWHVMGCGHPVTGPEFFNPFPHFNHIACHLVSQDQWDLITTVPLHDVAPAYPADNDLHEQLARPYFRHRHLFDADVRIAVIHEDFHGFVPCFKS